MGKYDEYTYGRALRFFEAYYPYDTEDVHYADVMLSMSQCKTIDELIAVRERLKVKINKINQNNMSKLPDDISRELSECVSKVLSWNNACFKRLKENLKKDVETCYDENIVRLLREKEQITDTFCGECFVNSSNCSTNSNIKESIIRVAKEKANLDIAVLLEEIAKRYSAFYEHWWKYKDYTKDMNGYLPAKQLVADDFTYLVKFDWRNASSYHEFLPKKEIRKERDSKEKEEEERKQKELRNKAIATIIIKVIIGVILFVGVILLLAQIPSGVWNWIWAFIVWLAIMKTILSKM